ncbi:MAG TPA: DUF3592 domain-containing protein [Candidatus Omnitrophota bacterium]|nr:DUF3592 domain-containing protein [Candidatus Omnitrophota bacterium]HPN56493.1 DUF3592 domain-containing protein [Candidatus Omnitrophota bacterium]
METLIFSLFAAIGGGIVYLGYLSYVKSRASQSWPAAQGAVVSSEVTAHRSRSRKGHHRTSYGADVRYEYSVNGVQYSSNKISFGEYRTHNRGPAQATVDRYPPQAEVVVYYNPDKPEEAVLEPGKTGGIVILFIVGGMFGLAGVLGLMGAF